MIMSMTGYGSAERITKQFTLKIEVKTVNQRYLDINVKGPKKFIKFEDVLRNVIKNNITRGKIDLFINVANQEREDIEIVPDLSLISKYVDAYAKINEHFGINDRIDLKSLMRIPDSLIISDKDMPDEEILEILSGVLQEALDNLKNMRVNEGIQIGNDILARLDDIEQTLISFESLIPEILVNHKEKMMDRIKDLMSESENFNQERLDMEVAIFADKKDITEEITRMNSHISQIRNLVNTAEPVGRKLDFIIQEMNREVNTMGSKSPSLDVTNTVIHLKSELEKIREQAQNIE